MTGLFGPLFWLVLLLGMALAPAFVPFVWFPWLALLPGAFFGVRWWRARRNRWFFVASIAWIGFALYELRMQAWSKAVVAPIRVDLFLVAPILVGLNIPAIVGMLRNRGPGNGVGREGETSVGSGG